jgi:hypothetical protein
MPANSIPMKGAVGPFGDYISIGGVFTIVKVRDRLESYDKDPGWYRHPRGTVALKANAAELARDGIDVHARRPEPLTVCQTPRHPGPARRDIPRRRRCLSIVIASGAIAEGHDGLGVRPLLTRRSIGATAGRH